MKFKDTVANLYLGLLRHEGPEDAVVERDVLGGAAVDAAGLVIKVP